MVVEIERRDCGGSLESAAEKLKKVTAETESCRIKKNFKRVSVFHILKLTCVTALGHD